MSTTSIEWTNKTWNPVAGCSIVSPGCTNCYAMRMAARLEAMGQAKYAGTTHKVNGHAVWTGKITLDEAALAIPLKTRKPQKWFVNSMSDLFHESVPFEFVDKVFAVMALTPHHTYQILTKRPERMAEYLNGKNRWVSICNVVHDMERAATDRRVADHANRIQCKFENHEYWPLPNVWLGTSCEDQKRANERIPHLLKCHAAVRFLSCEPLIGGIELHDAFYRPRLGPQDSYKRPMTIAGVHWVIVGGESGPGARACNIGWIRSLVEECDAAGVACFVKQLGADPYHSQLPHADGLMGARVRLHDSKGGDIDEFPEDLRVRQFPQAH